MGQKPPRAFCDQVTASRIRIRLTGGDFFRRFFPGGKIGSGCVDIERIGILSSSGA
jgi:hypothetical protein